MDTAQLKAAAYAAIDRNAEKIIAIGEQVWKNPEPGYREFKTAKLAADTLKSLGLDVREKLGPTGVRADMCGRNDGPTVAMLAELDSLILPTHKECDPVTGAVHACGHHASVAGMLGAAMALKEIDAASCFDGNVAFICTPAEECIEIAHRMEMMQKGEILALGGKADLIRRGTFDDVDLSIYLHASKKFGYGPHNGFLTKKVTFLGKACHAALPGSGISALGASAVAQCAIGILRERWSDDHTVRLHGIITAGGDVVNIIPDQTCMEFLVRAGTIDKIKQLNAEFDRAMTGAALAVGAGVKIETITGYMPHYDDHGLEELYDSITAEIAPEEPNTHSYFHYGSTDMGDLSSIMPTLHAYIPGTAGVGHGCDYRVARPELSYIANAKIQAGLLIELLTNGAEFAKAVAGRREGKLAIADYIKLTDSFNNISILQPESSIDAITVKG